MASTDSVPDQISQLNDARKLVLTDAKFYSGIVKGILPIIGPTAHIELRRWGAEFLAEAFATPALPNGEKETMQPYVLATLESMLENESEDPQVSRNLIQTAASIYPLAMRWIINNGYDTITWEKIISIKQRILRIWEDSPPSVKISCIKFAQRVVLSQSIASAETRYGGTLDVSLDKVPQNHQTLAVQNLEAEAMGLLDRMLSVLQETGDALIVDATLNCLSILVRTRPETSNRILNALLTFDPLKFAQSPLTPKAKVIVRSMEKTSRSLLLHLSKRDPHNPIVPRIQQHVERTMRLVAEAYDTTGKKRALEAQQHDGYDAKRQKTAVPQAQIQSLGPGPHTLADIFSLTDVAGLKTFDLSQVPAPLIAKLVVNTLSRIEPTLLMKSIEAVHSRLHTLARAAQEVNPNTALLGVEEEDDDYEPDFSQAEDTEQILNRLDNSSTVPNEQLVKIDSGLGLKAFSLAQPQPLSADMALSAGNGIVARVVEMMKTAEDPAAKKNKAGFTRLAASSGIRESWVTILTRLATRSTAGLEKVAVKGEEEATWNKSLGNDIREVLYNYIMEDFRKHLDVAVSWLCEEWYNDRMHGGKGDYLMHYEKCALRLIDGFLPYLHPQDKVLTRFLSEIPELSQGILSRVKAMCRDPSVVDLALKSLLYLVIMRPPVKEIALDTVQGIWTDYEDARQMAAKYLSKYRPAFLEAAKQETDEDGSAQNSAATAVTA